MSIDAEVHAPLEGFVHGKAGSRAASPPHQSDQIPTQNDTATSGRGSASNVVEEIAEHIVTGVEQVFTPRLRGFIHLHAVWIAVAAGATLVSVSWALVGLRAGLATLAYTIATVALFAVSATYHRVQWKSATAEKWMTRADHSMIFIFIAGCYTPFALVAFPPAMGSQLMWIVWSGALAGVTLKLFWPSAPRWVGVPLYLLLGWVAVWYAGALLEHAGITAMVLLAVGGGFYSIGAIFYATSWPNPWPATFGHHEFFHACTVIAAICHYIAIWFAVFHN